MEQEFSEMKIGEEHNYGFNRKNKVLKMPVIKWFLLIFIFMATIATAQVSPTKIVRVQSLSTQFGTNLPDGTLIIDLSTEKLYQTIKPVENNQSLSTLVLGTDYREYISDIPYNTDSWDNNTDAATKNAIRDELEKKENASNKSASTSLGTSDILFPTQNAVKTYIDSRMGASSASDMIQDADQDTKIQVEKIPNDDEIHFDIAGTEKWVMRGSRLEAVNTGQSLFIGKGAGVDATGEANTFLGYQSGLSNTSGEVNTAVGASSLYSNTSGTDNAAFGYSALYSNTFGYSNTAFGSIAMFSNIDGTNNAAIGNSSLYSNTSGNNNIAVGFQSNYFNQQGNNNVTLGIEAGRGTSTHNKSGNVFIGYQAGYNETGSNKLYIENSNSASPLVYGEFDNDLLRVNGNLDVTGPLRIRGGDPALGKVLTSDADGNAVWGDMATGSGTVTNVTSATTGQLTVATGTTTPALSIVTGAVADAGTALATGDHVYDFVTGQGYLTAEVDGSVTNEIQDLTLTGNTLSLSGDATTVDLSAYLDNTDDQTLPEILAANPSAGIHKITDVVDPTENQDAATKKYVDDQLGSASVTTENGLTNNAGTVELGGDINRNTTFDGDFNIDFGNTTPIKNMNFTISNSFEVQTQGVGDLNMSTGTGITLFDLRAPGEHKGMEYAANYSADFTDRSLVDKAFVNAQANRSEFITDDYIQPDQITENPTMAYYRMSPVTRDLTFTISGSLPDGFVTSIVSEGAGSYKTTVVPGGVAGLYDETGQNVASIDLDPNRVYNFYNSGGNWYMNNPGASSSGAALTTGLGLTENAGQLDLGGTISGTSVELELDNAGFYVGTTSSEQYGLDINTDGNGGYAALYGSKLDNSGGLSGVAAYGNYVDITAQTDGVNQRHVTYKINGFEYDVDLSALNTTNPRWIPDKAYVDDKQSVSAITTVTSDYSALITDGTILVNASSGSVTVILPAASAKTGLKLVVKRIDNSGIDVLIASAGGTIDGALNTRLNVAWQAYTIQSDGSNWYIIGRF